MSQMRASFAPAMRRRVCLACKNQSQQPVASTSSRTFTTTALSQAKLVEHKLGKDDPMDIQNLEQFRFDDIPWMGHLKLEKDRERLHLLRLIEFQFPSIANLRVPYKPPPRSDMIKLRTVYNIGDPSHPGSRKAVITLSINDLVQHGDKLLQSKQAQHKFKLLAGPRWNPDDDTIKIACDNFPTFNMNSKWCSDALDRLIAEARDTTDPMNDIPLDTRHADARKAKKSRRRATINDIPAAWLNLPGVKQK